MSNTSELAPASRFGVRRIIAVILALLSVLLTVGALVGIYQALLAPQPQILKTPVVASPQLHLIREVALPSIIVPPAGHAPIQGMPFDGFDFQTLDPHTGLLFITHAGPGASKLVLDQKQLPPGTHFQSQPE